MEKARYFFKKQKLGIQRIWHIHCCNVILTENYSITNFRKPPWWGRKWLLWQSSLMNILDPSSPSTIFWLSVGSVASHASGSAMLPVDTNAGMISLKLASFLPLPAHAALDSVRRGLHPDFQDPQDIQEKSWTGSISKKIKITELYPKSHLPEIIVKFLNGTFLKEL